MVMVTASRGDYAPMMTMSIVPLMSCVMTSHNLAQQQQLAQMQRVHYDNCRNCGATPEYPGRKCTYCGSTPTPMVQQGGNNTTLGGARW